MQGAVSQLQGTATLCLKSSLWGSLADSEAGLFSFSSTGVDRPAQQWVR